MHRCERNSTMVYFVWLWCRCCCCSNNNKYVIWCQYLARLNTRAVGTVANAFRHLKFWAFRVRSVRRSFHYICLCVGWSICGAGRDWLMLHRPQWRWYNHAANLPGNRSGTPTQQFTYLTQRWIDNFSLYEQFDLLNVQVPIDSRQTKNRTRAFTSRDHQLNCSVRILNHSRYTWTQQSSPLWAFLLCSTLLALWRLLVSGFTQIAHRFRVRSRRRKHRKSLLI